MYLVEADPLRSAHIPREGLLVVSCPVGIVIIVHIDGDLGIGRLVEYVGEVQIAVGLAALVLVPRRGLGTLKFLVTKRLRGDIVVSVGLHYVAGARHIHDESQGVFLVDEPVVAETHLPIAVPVLLEGPGKNPERNPVPRQLVVDVHIYVHIIDSLIGRDECVCLGRPVA